jgi:membrane protein DedA with SNARE-associated domain
MYGVCRRITTVIASGLVGNSVIYSQGRFLKKSTLSAKKPKQKGGEKKFKVSAAHQLMLKSSYG